MEELKLERKINFSIFNKFKMTVSTEQHLDEIRTVKSGYRKRMHREEKSVLRLNECGGYFVNWQAEFHISLLKIHVTR